MDADGKNLRRLTKHPRIDARASWFGPSGLRPVSPAGKRATVWGKLKQLGRKPSTK